MGYRRRRDGVARNEGVLLPWTVWYKGYVTLPRKGEIACACDGDETRLAELRRV